MDFMDMSLEGSEPADILLVEDFSIENTGDGDDRNDFVIESVESDR